MIISHDNPIYRTKWRRIGSNKYNGAFYYSKEIVKNIIPNVKTDRNWVTVLIPSMACDHSIVFIHNNIHTEKYEFLKGYDDVILVCGIPETCEKVKEYGTPIYLPLSIDVDYVKSFALPKTELKGAAFVGRKDKRQGIDLPDGIDYLEGMKRQKLLKAMAAYEYVYAVGRTAIEAKALGCKLKAYDPRFPKVSRWKVLDNKDAAKLLQEELDKIDKS